MLCDKVIFTLAHWFLILAYILHSYTCFELLTNIDIQTVSQTSEIKSLDETRASAESKERDFFQSNLCRIYKNCVLSILRRMEAHLKIGEIRIHVEFVHSSLQNLFLCMPPTARYSLRIKIKHLDGFKRTFYGYLSF